MARVHHRALVLTLLLVTAFSFSFLPTVTFAEPTHTITRTNTTRYETLESPRAIAPSDAGFNLLTIGFPFYYNGTKFDVFTLADDGYLLFPPYPKFSFFETDLYPMIGASRQYDASGIFPFRRFLLRLTNVPYASTHSQLVPPSVSIDVVFFEFNSSIEIRFHRVDPSPQSVRLSTPDIDYNTASTQVLSVNFASSLQNSAVTFTPIHSGIIRSDVYLTSGTTPAPDPVQLPSPVSASRTMPIGFRFTFFGRTYDTVYLRGFACLSFSPPLADDIYVHAMLDNMPQGNEPFLPAIFFGGLGLFTDGEYATLGNRTDRVFVWRTRRNSLGVYPRYSASLVPMGTISIDILLYEGSGDIVLRYYGIELIATQNVLIGIQAQTVYGTIDYCAVNNYRFGSLAFSNSEIRFTRHVFGPLGARAAPYSYSYAITAAPSQRSPLDGSATVTGFETARSIIIHPAFRIFFFGSTYDILMISDTGVITFGSTTLGSKTPPAAASEMPFSSSTNLPIFAFAFTDTQPGPLASISKQTTGTFPSRVLLLHIDNLCYAANVSLGVSVDVRFFELTGVIETMYYRLDPTDQRMLIGIQGNAAHREDYTFDFVAPLNNGNVDVHVTRLLLGKTLTYTPTQPVPPPTESNLQLVASTQGAMMMIIDDAVFPRVSLPSISANVVSGIDAVLSLGFSFSMYGTAYPSILVSANGWIQLTSLASGRVPNSRKWYAPWLPWSPSPAAPFIAPLWSDFNATSTDSIRYQLFGTQPLRFFVVQYVNVPAAAGNRITADMDVVFFETSNRIEFRYFSVGAVLSDVQIGMQGAAATDYGTVWNSRPLGASGSGAWSYRTVMLLPTLPVLNTMSAYSVSFARTAVTPLLDLGAAPMTAGLPSGVNQIASISLQGMQFPFNGVVYWSVYVSTNGNVQFTTRSSAASPYAFPGQHALSPFIAVFWTPLYISSGALSYQLLRSTSTRVFVLRYDRVVSAPSTTPTFTADVLLYESTGVVELRYYTVNVVKQVGVQIGVQATLDEYASVWNGSPISLTAAQTLSASKVTIAPKNGLVPSKCFIGGSDFAQLNSGNVLNKTIGSSTFYISPCNNHLALTTGNADCADASVCRCDRVSASNATATCYNLAFMRNLPILTRVDDSLVTSLQGGGVGDGCNSYFYTVIQFFCASGAAGAPATTRIMSLVRPSSCEYTIDVSTPLACQVAGDSG